MRDALMLTLALLFSLLGLSWFALAMEVHWTQVYAARRLSARKVAALRMLGSVALIISLLLCLRVDHVSMAVLVWIMSLAASAILIAMTFAWRPRLMRIL